MGLIQVDATPDGTRIQSDISYGVGRVRNPAILMRKFKTLEAEKCPFSNLPETRSGRWGVGLTAKKMEDCRWLRPVLVGQFEFVEWTPEGRNALNCAIAARGRSL